MYCSRCGAWASDEQTVCTVCQSPLARPLEEPTALPATPSPVAGVATLTPAGFWRRFTAGLVDGLLLFFPEALFRVALGLPLFSVGMQELSQPRPVAVLGTMIVLRWLYCSTFEASKRQGTLGQQLLGLRVTDLLGARIGFGRATLRHFGQWLSSALVGIGYLCNLWTRRRQTLHDLIAQTLVLREPFPETVTPEST